MIKIIIQVVELVSMLPLQNKRYRVFIIRVRLPTKFLRAPVIMIMTLVMIMGATIATVEHLLTVILVEALLIDHQANHHN